MIRKATVGDMAQILEIYEDARKFMADNGNPTQWGTSHPEQEILEKDIKDAVLYVITAENSEKRDKYCPPRSANLDLDNPTMQSASEIIGVFAFIIGEDSTYAVLDGGKWSSNDTYGTIHRLAAKPGYCGIFKACIDFCKGIHDYLRIDTHENNEIMHHNIQKAGFEKCGIIYAYDGSPRVAYDKKF